MREAKLQPRPSAAFEKAKFAENVLVQEYLRLCSDIRSLESTGDRLVGVAIALLGVAATIGIERDIDIIFVIVPIVIVGFTAYYILLYFWIFSMCGYKRHIENLINHRAGERLLLWGAIVKKREQGNVVKHLIIATYVLVLTGVVTFCVVQVRDAYGARAGWGLTAIIALALVLLIVAWRQRSTIGQYTSAVSRSLYNEAGM